MSVYGDGFLGRQISKFDLRWFSLVVGKLGHLFCNQMKLELVKGHCFHNHLTWYEYGQGGGDLTTT